MVTSLALLIGPLVTHGENLGRVKVPTVIGGKKDIYLVSPEYFWWDIFSLFPRVVLYRMSEDRMSKVLEGQVAKLEKMCK